MALAKRGPPLARSVAQGGSRRVQLHRVPRRARCSAQDPRYAGAPHDDSSAAALKSSFGLTGARLAPQETQGVVAGGIDSPPPPQPPLQQQRRQGHEQQQAEGSELDDGSAELSDQTAEALAKAEAERERALDRVKALFQDGAYNAAGDGDGDGANPTNAVDPATLEVGSFVAHKKVGVGKFLGVLEATEESEEVVVLEYRDGTAKLPAAQAHRLLYRVWTPSTDGDAGRAPPPLSRLKDTRGMWARRLDAARRAAEEAVEGYQRKYLARVSTSRPAYPAPSREEWQRFGDAFGFDLTPDQAAACEAIEEALLRRDYPMDHLVTGDVGFGKTEVAVRAAFLAARSGGQVMILCPTTVLAKQHYRVLSRRLEPFGLRVAMLSRLVRRKKDRDAVVDSIREGTVDVVVGTHALLSKDVSYERLKLLVIDEEQRFGVRHKERMTQMATAADVLTLTATPIPRTVALSAKGLRELSRISTPPTGRQPVCTSVVPYDRNRVDEVIRAEAERGGQIIYVVPRVNERTSGERTSGGSTFATAAEQRAEMRRKVERQRGAAAVFSATGDMQEALLAQVEGDSEDNFGLSLAERMRGHGEMLTGQSIDAVAAGLRLRHPDLKVMVAHGRLSPLDLDTVMDDMQEGRADILVSTTLVENGLDISTANTIVVEDSQLFGLAQLHQLRGRVGRSSTHAHAMFLIGNATWQTRVTLDQLAAVGDGVQFERLNKLQEEQGLGAGFAIAEYDARLRGYGELFGVRQSGFDGGAVGDELMLELIYSAMRKLKFDRASAAGVSAEEEANEEATTGSVAAAPS